MTSPSATNTALAEELLPRWIDNPTCPIDRPYSRRLVPADECRPAVALALQSKDDSAALEIARLRAALEPFSDIAPEMRNTKSIVYGVGDINVYCSDFHAARAVLQTDGGKL